jgi:hypothetical protein
MIEARYKYGAYVKERLPGKQFVWRQANGEKGLNGALPPLYREDELRAAIEAGRTVLIVEGEKDVDTASQYGITATCSPHGSSSWPDVYTPIFRNASVVVVQDNDAPGIRCARAAANAISGVAASVKLLLPLSDRPGGDLADYFEEGGTREGLAEIIRQTPEYEAPPEPERSSQPAANTNGEVADNRKRKYAAAALERMAGDLSMKGPGTGRNDELNSAAFTAGRFAADGSITEDEARDTLLAACESNGLTKEDGRASVKKTFASGFSSGLNDPFDWSTLPDRPWPVVSYRSNGEAIERKEEADSEDDDAAPFWYLDDKERLKIDRTALLRTIESGGFCKIYLPDQNVSTLIRRSGKVIDYASPEQVKDFVLSRVSRLPDNLASGITRDSLQNSIIAGGNVYFSAPTLEFLRSVSEPFARDTEDAAHFYFRNGRLTVTAQSVEFHEDPTFSTAPGLIWRSSIIPREFRTVPQEDVFFSEIGTFFANTQAGRSRPVPEEMHRTRVRALCSAVGYMLHRHKNPALARSVILTDEALSDVPSGRSGKSICGQAVAQMVPTKDIDGRNFRFNQFAFQGVKYGTAVMHFDDASRGFPFDRLFHVITGGLDVEEKGLPRYTIPFADAPKVLITTNYVIEGIGGSHEDRVFEVEFTDYYTASHKPGDDFGHRLFDDWSDDEWCRFFNYMAMCAQLYLKHGLIDYPRVNIKTKKLEQMTSREFVEWIDNGDGGSWIETGKPYDKKELFRQFVEDFPEVANTVSQAQLTRWIGTWAQLHGLRKIDGKSDKIRTVTVVP